MVIRRKRTGTLQLTLLATLSLLVGGAAFAENNDVKSE